MHYTLRFFLSSKCILFHNTNLFGSCIIHILYTGCAEIKKKYSGAKGLNAIIIFFFKNHVMAQILSERNVCRRLSTVPKTSFLLTSKEKFADLYLMALSLYHSPQTTNSWIVSRKQLFSLRTAPVQVAEINISKVGKPLYRAFHNVLRDYKNLL